MHNFLSSYHILCNPSIWDKGDLSWVNEFTQQRLQSIHKDLRYYLVTDITETYRMKLIKITCTLSLGDESCKCLIKFFKHPTFSEKTLHRCYNLATNNRPIVLVKQSRKAIWSLGFERVHLKNYSLDLVS